MFNRSHCYIYVYLELCKSPAFRTVIPNKCGRLLVTVIEGGGGGGGGALASINNP